MSYYTIFSTIFQCQNMNKRKNPRTASSPGAIRRLFYSCSKLNRYLRAILQGINQAVIAHDGNFIDHSVPELFVEFDGRCGGSVSSKSIPPMATDSASLFLRSAERRLSFFSSARKRSVRSPKRWRYSSSQKRFHSRLKFRLWKFFTVNCSKSDY